MTRSIWTLTDAKARFSAVVQRALDGTPQRIIRNGREAVIVVAETAYEASRPKKSLVELFAPLQGTNVELGARGERNREAPTF